MRLSCGDTYCQPCVESQKLEGNKCQKCQTPIIPLEVGKDMMVNWFLEEISVYCKNLKPGCKWQGAFKDYENHLKNACKFKTEAADEKDSPDEPDEIPKKRRNHSPDDASPKPPPKKGKPDKKIKMNKKK
jgi:hypothetical protein